MANGKISRPMRLTTNCSALIGRMVPALAGVPELTTNHVERDFPTPGHQPRDPVGLGVELRHHVPGEVRALGVEGDLLPHDGGDLLLDAPLGIGEDAEDQGGDGREGALEDGVGQGGLGPEVVVHQRLVDAGLVGDLLGAAPRRALPDEDRVGGIEDPLAGLEIGLGREGF